VDAVHLLYSVYVYSSVVVHAKDFTPPLDRETTTELIVVASVSACFFALRVLVCHLTRELLIQIREDVSRTLLQPGGPSSYSDA
jgi:hypothetical protein